ncbi:MAG: hypothetical protein ACSHX7_01320 [Luteolibacter sp.]
MFRLLILIAALPIIAAFVARWWFGMKVIASKGQHQCKCDLEKWSRTFGDENLPLATRADARVYAELLRKSALEDWRTREPKTATSREGGRRFGMAVPPLALMIAILAMIIGKIPVVGAIAIFLLAIAFAVIISYLGIAPELKAILVTSRRLKDARIFPRTEDELAVLRTTTALAWKEAAPPVFNLLQR